MRSPTRPRARLLAAVASGLVAASAAAAQEAGDGGAGAQANALALGQRIYREGIGASGAPLPALGAARARLAGKDVACAACHRRSGYGTNEGQFVIRPITGPALRDAQTVPVHVPRVKARLGARQRPAYTEASLARAIRSGLDSTGTPLSPAMPRYALDDEDMKALTAYLFSLSVKPSPGVDEHDIHFATVIQPGVAPERRRAMLQIMEAFVRDKDANARGQVQRREAGNFRRYRAYRNWVLHVWELSGPPASWGAQLEAFYQRQPVFALVGGLGGSSWQPIHEFSERFEIPCVFPQVDLPDVSGSGYYTFYLSRGVLLEAEVLAKYLGENGARGKILQVYRRDDPNSAAAAAFRTAYQAPPGAALEERVLDGQGSEAFWREVAGERPEVLVLWLGAQDLEGAQALGGPTSPAIYLSSQLLAGTHPPAALRKGANVRLIYPSDLPPKREARLLRNKIWLHNKGIPVTEESLQMNTQFAMSIVSDAVGHILDSFSRDYFVERIEHVVSQTPIPSAFAQVSLGPGQRFAAKGSFVVQWGEADKSNLKALSDWIVP